MQEKEYVLGIDMGATSLGWSVLKLDSSENICGIIDMGVRIFPDGREDKTKQPLTVTRRKARGMRRRLHRLRIRYNTVKTLLKEAGLLPNEESMEFQKKMHSPYFIRAKAVREMCSLEEIAIAILHITKRRGFLSNRKERTSEGGGKVQEANKRLSDRLQGRTLGEFYYEQIKENQRLHGKEKQKPIRLKNLFDSSGKLTSNEALYPTRAMYEEELDRIWKFQQEYHPTILTEDLRKKIFGEDKKTPGVFFQRPLKAQELGACFFEPTQSRCYKAHPLFQKFRIWQSINRLTYKPDPSSEAIQLTKEQRETLFSYLYHFNKDFPKTKKVIPFSKIIKVLGIPKTSTFNLFTEDGLPFNTTAYYMSQPSSFGEDWEHFSDEIQCRIVEILCDSTIDDEVLLEELQELLPQYPLEHLEKILNTPLENGTASLSLKAISNILPHLEEQFQYHEACANAGYHHSKQEIDSLERLPYYGVILTQHCLHGDPSKNHVIEKYGRIMNATVHIALNELRVVVNELIARYGKPTRIVIEVARDIAASTDELGKMIRNQQKNKAIRDNIAKELIQSGVFQNREDISREAYQKYILWERLHKDPLQRCCPYTGKPINIKSLYTQEFEIEHILPFSRTFDDSINNKTISYFQANRQKGNRSPYEAFYGIENNLISWSAIEARVQDMSKCMDERTAKAIQWRFEKGAMDSFSDEGKVLERQLNDTRYMSRMAAQYLKAICRNPNNVYVVPGRLTSLLRDKWNLNTFKDKENIEAYRGNHLHHAVDAFVIACTTRSLVRRARELADQAEEERKKETVEHPDTVYREDTEKKKYFKGELQPFEEWKNKEVQQQFWQTLYRSVISYRKNAKDVGRCVKNKQTTGALMEDTAYGLVDFLNENSLDAIFIHKGEKSQKTSIDLIPIFTKKEDRERYYALYKEYYIHADKARTMNAKTKEEKAKKEYQKLYEENLIRDLQEVSKKALKWHIGGSNYSAEVYEIHPSNTILGVSDRQAGEIKAEIISTFEAHRRALAGEYIGYWKLRYPNAKKLFSLRINDMVIATFSSHDDQDKLPKGIKDLVLHELAKEKERMPNAEEVTIDIIFRVKKLGGGAIWLRPHFIAKENADTKTWQASASSLKRYKAQKIEVNALGKYKRPDTQ